MGGVLLRHWSGVRVPANPPFSNRNPKFEIRNPEEIRSPKAEKRFYAPLLQKDGKLISDYSADSGELGAKRIEREVHPLAELQMAEAGRFATPAPAGKLSTRQFLASLGDRFLRCARCLRKSLRPRPRPWAPASVLHPFWLLRQPRFALALSIIPAIVSRPVTAQASDGKNKKASLKLMKQAGHTKPKHNQTSAFTDDL